MASSASAVLAALASALVAVHRSGIFDYVPVPPAAAWVEPQCDSECHCRVHVDQEFGVVREWLLVAALSPDQRIEYLVALVFVFAVIGAVVLVLRCARCCCGRPGRFEAKRLRISHGDRRVRRT